jgi:hypothetical protein
VAKALQGQWAHLPGEAVQQSEFSCSIFGFFDLILLGCVFQFHELEVVGDEGFRGQEI